ncbi:HD domain-containing phosphohydrolase [Pseudorhodoferax sp. Leaf274]|uniref:HD domain-containing phosphohydrolase n=1 Tax=Pseudorhodoferax sp. Leaf274 TaxID=1736318 RepID=UPI0019102EBF|nr:HD domain-containing phosphohydrolase [Pseudorhodoferax sp. Leaf274]
MRWALQPVLGTALVVLLLVVTATLIRIAFVKFEEMAKQSANVIFAQQVQQGSDLFSGLMGRVRAQVDVAATMGFDLDARGTPVGALERQWIASLAVEPGLYSQQLTLKDGRYFQAIALRRSAALAQALRAPEGARFATRAVGAPAADGRRTETWRFVDAAASVLAERQSTTQLDAWHNPVASAAMASPDTVVTRPAPFFTTSGAGVTVARRLANGAGFASAEIATPAIEQLFAGLAYSPHAAGALIDPAGRVVASGAGREALAPAGGGGAPSIGDPAAAALQELARWETRGPAPEVRVAELDGEQYVLAQSSLEVQPGERWRVVAYAPLSRLFGFMFIARDRMAAFSALVVLVALLIALIATKRIVGTLDALTRDAIRICTLDFGPTPRIRSRLQEFSALAEAHAVMRDSIRSGTEELRSSRQRLEELIAAGLAMSRERNMMHLLQQILFGAKRLTRCDAATLYIVTENRTLRFALRTRDDSLPQSEIPLRDADGRDNDRFVSTYVALHNKHVVIDDVYTEQRFDLSGTRSFDERTGYRTVSMLALPLAPREGEVIGVLQLMNALDPITGKAVPFSEEDVQLASALAAQAAVSLDNHQLVQAQSDLVDSMVRLLAGAIDAKSPYTGGHCERVPELAIMLAEEATRVEQGPLAHFRFETAEQWREFRIGAWLHDCGKITTPEYVVDKATKLETIHDRIHEIRTRFEILWRDAEIDCLKARLTGADKTAAQARRDARQAQLREEFAFVARCNIGAEYMEEERVTRLHAIGSQTWWRHFDDRLGLGHEAAAALQDVPVAPLPAMERLLDDKPQHIVARPPAAVTDPRHGFKMDVPEHLYNRGELHNLSVSRGTLTAEERYKINEHITQTIVMLESMNFPKNLRRVPEYAGTHHENLKGTGYPRQLQAAELPVPARIMAVADIFEALTAADRPYKKSKPLSEAVEILWGFKRRGHIDPDVFDLFLTSGVYLQYAHRFLSPELIDAVDIDRYVGPVAKAAAPAAARVH